MNLTQLNDKNLLTQTKQLVKKERESLTQILHHLREVERRKLYSDLKYQSLFDYAVKELKYSEGQAARRITAMRLLKELPQLEKKIEEGKLNLSNLSQAKSFFKEQEKEKKIPIPPQEKLSVLKDLENQTTREAQRTLLKLNPKRTLPPEKQRPITEKHTEVRFIMDKDLEQALEKVRTLLGPKGATMKLSELIAEMAKLTQRALEAKKFGKKRAETQPSPETPTTAPLPRGGTESRTVSRATRYFVWRRDNAKCTQCQSTRDLNIDHIRPFALGGGSHPSNLRLLCRSCNQRAAIRVFGVDKIAREATSPPGGRGLGR